MAPAMYLSQLIVAALLTSPPPQTGAAPQRQNPEVADRTAAQSPESDANMQLFSAAMLGDLGGIQKALAGGAQINAVSDSGSTALALAALHGHVDAINALLTAGANIAAADTGGATPLMIAAAQGHTRVVEALAARGAD